MSGAMPPVEARAQEKLHMVEEWRRLPSPYRNYEVSNFGDVRRGSRKLKGQRDRYGYLNVNLYQCGMGKKFKVHRLVCAAFHGPNSEGHDACHIDGSRDNNSALNLKWGTRAENVADAVRHGTHHSNLGQASPTAKLSVDDVKAARKRHAAGESGRSLAKCFGITSANMSRLLRGDTWASVRQDAPEPRAHTESKSQ